VTGGQTFENAAREKKNNKSKSKMHIKHERELVNNVYLYLWHIKGYLGCKNVCQTIHIRVLLEEVWGNSSEVSK